MSKKSNPRELITFRLLPSVIEILKRRAEEERRSQANYLEGLILEDLKKNEELKKGKP